MDIVIHEQNKAEVSRLIDPTRFEVVRRYLELPIGELDDPSENIEYIINVQEGYELAEVVSPFIIHKSEDPSTEPEIDGKSQSEYLFELLSNGVIRFIFESKENVNPQMIDYVDFVYDFDQNESYEVFMAPPIYWIKSLSNRW